jgi:hypothetical protein
LDVPLISRGDLQGVLRQPVILRRIKVFSHFFRTGCSLVSRGTGGLSAMKILTTASSRSGGKIFSYFFHFQGLFNSRGLDDVKGFVPLSTSREADGCMKDTDHHLRHPRGHLGARASAQETRGCVCRDDQFGRGQNTVLGWSDPTFAYGSVAKVIPGSLQPTRRFLPMFCPRVLPNS